MANTAIEASFTKTTIVILHNPEITAWYKTGERDRETSTVSNNHGVSLQWTQPERPTNVRKLVTVLLEVCTQLAWSINYKPALAAQR